MEYAIDLVVIEGVNYAIDFKRELFTNIRQPEITIPFETDKGQTLCAALGMTKCHSCGSYISAYELGCGYCEHILLCE